MPSGAATSRTCARCAINSRAGLVHGFDRRAGEFELAARLQRDGAAAGDVEQADDVVVLHDRLPAEQVVHAVEQRADAARALIGHRAVVFEHEGEFLVLGADAELLARLAAGFQPRDEFVAAFDRASGRSGHGPCGGSPEGRGADHTRGPVKRAITGG